MPSTRDQAFDRIDALLTPTCDVIVVGPKSRTWFRDESQYYEILWWLHDRHVTPTIIGNKPFQLRVLEGATLVPGLRMNLVEEAEAGTAISLASVCIAFGSRADAQRFADDEATEQAILARQIPMLLMDAKGDVRLR